MVYCAYCYRELDTTGQCPFCRQNQKAFDEVSLDLPPHAIKYSERAVEPENPSEDA